jgi:hypothetical protein
MSFLHCCKQVLSGQLDGLTCIQTMYRLQWFFAPVAYWACLMW